LLLIDDAAPRVPDQAQTERRSRRHVAKFILVGLYTGTRAGAISGPPFQPTVGRGSRDDRMSQGLYRQVRPRH
jgi:hypothetical protein